MKNVVLSFVLFGILSGQTGKISGLITASETNQPLIGVSVVVEGAGIGADSDQEGRYVILNIPVGEYSLRTSYIGYASVKVTNLQVSSGMTTEQDFVLSQEAIAGEEVVVLADRPLIYKDLTSTQKITTSEEIEAMPVESFLGVLTTQAGVNVGAGGELHIRGGRSNEVGYYIDGVSVANPFFTNSLSVNLSNKALKELKVVSGGFNAEYGNAMSGIVNIQIKEGGQNYEGSISIYTGDRYSIDTDLYPNIDNFGLFNRRTVEGYFSGPLPLTGSKLTFNTSLRYSAQDGYLYGIREHTVQDYANFQTNDWYIQMGGNGDTVAMNPSESYNQLVKLTYKVSPKLKFSMQYLGSQGTSQSYVHFYKYNPDGRSTSVSDNYNLSLRSFINDSFNTDFYFSNSSYSYSKKESSAYQEQDILSARLGMNYNNNKLVDKFGAWVDYSEGDGTSSYSQYGLKFLINLKLYNNLFMDINLRYYNRKIVDEDDYQNSIIKANISYNF